MNLDQFECLSFDCYGTLIDWEKGILEALHAILKAHRISAEDTTLLELFARAELKIEAGPYRSYRSVLEAVLSDIGKEIGFEPSRDEQENFSGSVRNWPVFQDSSSALRALRTKYQLIILSNIDDDLFQFSERALKVKFDHIFTAQRIGSYKPAMRNFEYLIRNAGVPAHKLLHVAQSLFHDIVPAKKAGLSTVWVNRRRGKDGFGATLPAAAEPDLSVPDLRSLAVLAGTL
jgi:2-haloacid dehalogenase